MTMAAIQWCLTETKNNKLSILHLLKTHDLRAPDRGTTGSLHHI